MVVPVSTDFSRALTEPLEVIQDLFDKSSGGDTFTVDVQQHFDRLFNNDELRSKVPYATSSLLAQHGDTPAKLVRWRCMIQDTSLGNEVLPRQYRISGSSTARNGLFGAASRSATSSADAAPADGSGGFGSLTTMCGVSVPGETAWARGSTEDVGAEAKSSLPDKLPRGEGSAVLLKLYDEQLAESLHVTQVVDVLGIIDQSTLPSADWTSMGSGDAEPSSSTADAVHPTLHVISLRSEEKKDASHELDAASVRSDLIHFLSEGLAGDVLAAQWLLLALLARIHTRGAAHTMGALSLNIFGFPTPPASHGDEKVALYHTLHAVLPLLADQSLDLAHLNAPSTRFAPKSDADERGVRAGRLQLVPGTTLFLDEGTMNEGQLKDNGIANVRALSAVLQTHKLPYVFPFSTHEMDTDLPCVVVSQGKSFLPVDVQVPLQPSTADAAATLFQCPPSCGVATAAAAAAESGVRLASLRQYLRAVQQRSARSDAFTIPSSVSDRIQDDFVELRKKNQQHTGAAAPTTVGTPLALLDTQEDLARTIQVARLICLSHGQKELRWDDWQEAKRLDEERQRRMLQA